MPTKYTREETIKLITKASNDMPTFYRTGVVNYVGKSADTNEYYTEIVAEWLLNHMDYLSNTNIPVITRQRSYKSIARDGTTPNAASNRIEERIALDVKRNGIVPSLGTIIDYQTPLKDKQKDNAGKIDLLAYDECDVLRILELKKPGSKETLLRCVLEGYTYFLTVAQRKLLSDFQLAECKKLKVCPLFFKDSLQYKEYEQMLAGYRPHLMALIDKLDEELFLLSESGAANDPYGEYKKYSSQILKY